MRGRVVQLYIEGKHKGPASYYNNLLLEGTPYQLNRTMTVCYNYIKLWSIRIF